MMNKVDVFQACESTCNECILKGEVGNYKEHIFVEKEEIITKKDMKNKVIVREKKMKMKVFNSKKVMK